MCQSHYYSDQFFFIHVISILIFKIIAKNLFLNLSTNYIYNFVNFGIDSLLHIFI